ncbi:MAG: type II toxin-antitoxin system YafQ family toxin [Desulfovibrionaceae bacterium]|nr:type II toxin-antitoxin system YafQ family toxin [Desulfovibrionaceae bacterium]
MRTIERTSRFKRDFKREAAGPYGGTLHDDLRTVLTLLAADLPLPVQYRDHALAGEWKDHRDCHIRPDLVLIYRTPDAGTLQLVRLGSHSEPGL